MDNRIRLDAIIKRQAFKSINAEAFYINNEYIIKSYNTIIYSDSKGLDSKKYSHTTSKIQKEIAEAYNLSIPKKRINAINGIDFNKG